MNYNVQITSYFKKQVKRLLKKYPSLKSELSNLFSSLEQDPNQGVSLGNNCYKIRIAIASKNKGKSGGARIITHVQIRENSVYILSIYDKSDQSNIDENEILNLINLIPEN